MHIVWLLCCVDFFNMLLIFVMGSFTVVSRLFIDGMCEAALALTTKTMIGATFHLLIAILLMGSWYFVFFF